MRLFILVYVLSLFVEGAFAQRIKVACVGNSVTYGYTLLEREKTVIRLNWPGCWEMDMKSLILVNPVPLY